MKKKRVICTLFALLLCTGLVACSFGGVHCSQSEAQKIAEGLTGQDVTYVTTNENEEDKKKVYVFEDPDGNEFAIVSTLRQKNFDGLSYGKYTCHISDNYITAMVIAHKEEVRAILEEYNLWAYVDDIVDWDEDIRKGEGVNAIRIYLEIPAGDEEENLELLKKVAVAGSDIDELLSLSYDMEYANNAKSGGIKFDEYNSFNGIQVDFEHQVIGYDGEYWNKSEIVDFNFSTSKDERWGEEELLEYLYEQITDLEIAPLN